MNFATVVGTVWATQKHERCDNLVFQLIQPECASGTPFGNKLIAVDTIGAGPGERIFYVSSKEANIPLAIDMSPIDAAIVGIVDDLDHSEEVGA